MTGRRKALRKISFALGPSGKKKLTGSAASKLKKVRQRGRSFYITNKRKLKANKMFEIILTEVVLFATMKMIGARDAEVCSRDARI